MSSPIKSVRQGSQKGTFVGVPKGIHIHIVSDNTHIQVGKDRKNFDPDNDSQVKEVRTWLEKTGAKGRPGYDDCHAWLGQAKRR